MVLKPLIRIYLRESLNEQYNITNKEVIAYHGTRSFIPFEKFENSMIGTGLVSNSSAKYDGFFFTTEKDNAEFYTEYFICKVLINGVSPTPIDSKHPSTVLSLALKNNTNYIVEDVLDGAIFSDIVVVPKNNLDTIKIISWDFIGDEDAIFEKWDEAFGDEDGFINQDMIDDTIEMINLNLEFLLGIPIFKKYYNSKK